MPVGMTVFSIWGTVSAFGASPQFAPALGVWAATAALVFALVARTRANARYDAASRSYTLPGSVIPLALIAGIFLVKYFVGVEQAMAPQLMRDTQYALTVAALYGAFTGMFVGRAARLWRLAVRRPAVAPASA
jgi:predicted neutral ceramidase superfamily lipid hydrolase